MNFFLPFVYVEGPSGQLEQQLKQQLEPLPQLQQSEFEFVLLQLFQASILFTG
jgi:hypothetical protein